MNRFELEALVVEQGLVIDGYHQGAGLFRDVYIGTGQPLTALYAFVGVLRAAGVTAQVEGVTNPEHPDHGKAQVVVPSFWWECWAAW